MAYTVAISFDGHIADYTPHLETMDAARAEAASYLRRARQNGQYVYTIMPGRSWRVLAGDDLRKPFGFLRIRPIAHPYDEETN